MKRIHILIIVLLLMGLPLAANDSVRTVQQALADQGYDPGVVDGLMGQRTREAIRSFQRDQQLPVTGRMDAATQRALGVDVESVVTVPAGTRVEVFLDDSLSSQDAQRGDRFSMTVARSVIVDGLVAIPRQSTIRGRVVEVERAQRPQKGGKLVLASSEVSVRGERVTSPGEITADEKRLKGKGSLKDDWKKIGVAAGVGAVIGGVAGGGKGVLAGIAIGGGGTFLATKGEQVKLPAETRLIVQLSESIQVPVF